MEELEFYSKDIIVLIEPYFKRLNIDYRRLYADQISKLIRNKRVRDKLKEFEKRGIGSKNRKAGNKGSSIGSENRFSSERLSTRDNRRILQIF